jgi:hypothetical protein
MTLVEETAENGRRRERSGTRSSESTKRKRLTQQHGLMDPAAFLGLGFTWLSGRRVAIWRPASMRLSLVGCNHLFIHSLWLLFIHHKSTQVTTYDKFLEFFFSFSFLVIKSIMVLEFFWFNIIELSNNAISKFHGYRCLFSLEQRPFKLG